MFNMAVYDSAELARIMASSGASDEVRQAIAGELALRVLDPVREPVHPSDVPVKVISRRQRHYN